MSKSKDHTALRLAIIYFPMAADVLAPCYDRMAFEPLLQHVFENKDKAATLKISSHLALWKMLASGEFGSLLHVIYMYLDSADWLNQVAAIPDKGIVHGLHIQQAVIVVGTVHCSSSDRFFEEDREDFSRIIGYRSGAFAYYSI